MNDIEYQKLIKEGKYSEVLKLLEKKNNYNPELDQSDLQDHLDFINKDQEKIVDLNITENLDQEEVEKLNLQYNNKILLLDSSTVQVNNLNNSMLSSENPQIHELEDQKEHEDENKEEIKDELINEVELEEIKKKNQEFNKNLIDSLLQKNSNLGNNFISLNESNFMQNEDILSRNLQHITRRNIFPFKDNHLPFFEYPKEKVEINYYKVNINQHMKGFEINELMNIDKPKRFFEFPNLEEMNVVENSESIQKLDNKDIESLIQSKLHLLTNKNPGFGNKMNRKNFKIEEKKNKTVNINISQEKIKISEENTNGSFFQNLSCEKSNGNLENIVSSNFTTLFYQDYLNLKYLTSRKINPKQKLKSLNFQNQNLKSIEIPSKLIQFIKELNLSNNEIKEIPDVFNTLTSLSVLDLEKNKITKIKNLSSCIKLRNLNLSRNNIEVLENLSHIYLEKLNLKENKITLIQGIDSCQNIIELNLSQNKLSNIENLLCLQNLESLSLIENQISSIKNQFSFLFLRELYLNSNIINTFEIGPCLMLKELYLHNNKLSKIDSLKNCFNLKSLDISFNNIQSFNSILNIIKDTRSIYKFAYQENPFFKVQDEAIYRTFLKKILQLKYLNYEEIMYKNEKKYEGDDKSHEKFSSKQMIMLNTHNIIDIYKNNTKKYLYKIKDEFDTNKKEKKQDSSYFFNIELQHYSNINSQSRLILKEIISKISNGLNDSKSNISVSNIDSLLFNLIRYLAYYRKFDIKKIITLQKFIKKRKNLILTSRCIVIQKNFRRYRIRKRMMKFKDINIDEEIPNLNPIDDFFKNNSNFDDFRENSFNIEKFDFDKFIQDNISKKNIKIVSKEHDTPSKKTITQKSQENIFPSVIKSRPETGESVIFRKDEIRVEEKKIEEVKRDLILKNDKIKYPIISQHNSIEKNSLISSIPIDPNSKQKISSDLKLPQIKPIHHNRLLENSLLVSEGSKISSSSSNSKYSKKTVSKANHKQMNNNFVNNELEIKGQLYVPGNINDIRKRLEANPENREEIEKWPFMNEETKKNLALRIANFSNNKSKKMLNHVKNSEILSVQKYKKGLDRLEK